MYRVKTTEQEQIDVTARTKSVGRKRKVLGIDRSHQNGRNRDDDFRLVGLELCAVKQRTQDRNILEPGKSLHGIANIILEQPRDNDTRTARYLDGGTCAPGGQTRNCEPTQRNRALIGERTNLGFDLQADEVRAEDRGRKAQSNTKLPELDGHRAVRAGDWYRKLATGKKRRTLTRHSRKVWFREDLDQAIPLQSFQNERELIKRPKRGSRKG